MSDQIDTRVLEELQETVGSDFVVELIETFLAEAPGMLAELRQASEVGDADAVRRAAHSLKSNASTFGASTLAETARRIEVEGLGATPGQAIEALEAALDAATRALKARLDG